MDKESDLRARVARACLEADAHPHERVAREQAADRGDDAGREPRRRADHARHAEQHAVQLVRGEPGRCGREEQVAHAEAERERGRRAVLEVVRAVEPELQRGHRQRGNVQQPDDDLVRPRRVELRDVAHEREQAVERVVQGEAREEDERVKPRRAIAERLDLLRIDHQALELARVGVGHAHGAALQGDVCMPKGARSGTAVLKAVRVVSAINGT